MTLTLAGQQATTVPCPGQRLDALQSAAAALHAGGTTTHPHPAHAATGHRAAGAAIRFLLTANALLRRELRSWSHHPSPRVRSALLRLLRQPAGARCASAWKPRCQRGCAGRSQCPPEQQPVGAGRQTSEKMALARLQSAQLPRQLLGALFQRRDYHHRLLAVAFCAGRSEAPEEELQLEPLRTPAPPSFRLTPPRQTPAAGCSRRLSLSCCGMAHPVPRRCRPCQEFGFSPRRSYLATPAGRLPCGGYCEGTTSCQRNTGVIARSAAEAFARTQARHKTSQGAVAKL